MRSTYRSSRIDYCSSRQRCMSDMNTSCRPEPVSSSEGSYCADCGTCRREKRGGSVLLRRVALLCYARLEVGEPRHLLSSAIDMRSKSFLAGSEGAGDILRGLLEDARLHTDQSVFLCGELFMALHAYATESSNGRLLPRKDS